MASNAAPLPAGLEAWNKPATPPTPEETPQMPAVPKLANFELTSPFTAGLVAVSLSTLKLPAMPLPIVVTVITSLVLSSLKISNLPARPVAKLGTQA